MNTITITNKLVNILKNATELSYVKAVWLGERQTDNVDMYPNIWVEPEEKRTLRIKDGIIAEREYPVTLVGAVWVPADEEKAIISEIPEDPEEGELIEYGVKNLEEDVTTVLKKNFPDLDKTCLYFYFDTTLYQKTDSGQGRLFAMSIVFQYVEDVQEYI